MTSASEVFSSSCPCSVDSAAAAASLSTDVRSARSTVSLAYTRPTDRTYPGVTMTPSYLYFRHRACFRNKILAKVTPATFVEISAVRANFGWNFMPRLGDNICTLPSSFLKYIWNWQIYSFNEFNHDNWNCRFTAHVRLTTLTTALSWRSWKYTASQTYCYDGWSPCVIVDSESKSLTS